jgi:hypothetical protein
MSLSPPFYLRDRIVDGVAHSFGRIEFHLLQARQGIFGIRSEGGQGEPVLTVMLADED